MSKHLQRIADAYILEKIRTRRWKIFSRIIWIFVILMIVFLIKEFSGITFSNQNVDHIALIEVNGIIDHGSHANAKNINDSLSAAFNNKNTKAVIMQINSPGGSPVQADDVYSHMRYLQNQYPSVPLYAVCTDICASGGYYIASGAKYIYANQMTITGSIGVKAGGFGFVELLKNYGVERRLYTAGKDKGFLDSFKPQNPQQISAMESILSEIHQVFINSIKESRGLHINKSSEDVIFSGIPFSGIQAKNYGLIDGFSSVDSLIREKFNEIKLVNFTQPLNLFSRIGYKFSTEVVHKLFETSSVKLQ